MFRTAKSQWVWTDKAEAKFRDRKAGEPVWEMYRKTVRLSWVEKGYVREKEED